jgi:glutamate/tyrosine decarboxylase-like PLP-dependent enzyme
MTGGGDGVRLPARDELAGVIDRLAREARAYLAEVDERPVLSRRAEEALGSFAGRLPEKGVGAGRALEELLAEARDAAATTSGPRCFHFVIGGTTPAALGADWLATLFDQIAYTWVSSPLGVQLELIALDWLKELFELPASWSGVMTTGATMANFVGLAAARQWWGERLGVDVSEAGLAGLPPVPVFSSGHVHASAVKVLALLGIGRSSVVKLAGDGTGRLDVAALERALGDLDGRPAILIGNVGEVNAGDFDPIATMADLAAAHGCWLHVDGAFGLFARLSPRTAAMAAGVERADSVTVDGHKWLNVPYDCGFSFVRDHELLGRSFAYSAAYLPRADDPRPTLGAIGPEGSRRARALAVWATLRAYGRSGYRAMVEGHLDLARRLAARVDGAPELERLAEVPLNIVCFRFNPGGRGEEQLDALNRRLGEAIIADGRVFAGTTLYDGRVALRPAIVNWRTRPEDVDLFVDVVRELAVGLDAAS